MGRAVAYLEDRNVEPLADPLLEIVPTGATPRNDAEYLIMTSKTGVDCLVESGWQPRDTTVCAIGDATASALTDAGFAVDVVPADFTSSGLVEYLADDVAGATIEVARSDHGSDVLLTGLMSAGGYVHETVLYRLQRPEGSGIATEALANERLDGLLFTSSLTVDHFIAAAQEREIGSAVRSSLESCVIGAIGPPTAETAASHDISVDVIPEEAMFESLADAVIEGMNDRD